MIKWHTLGARKAADFLVHVDPAQLKAGGFELVAFYLKSATKEQVRAYQNAGLSVLMIHQRGYEGKLGATYGAKHGAEAKAQALALGYPTDLPIIFASMGDYDNSGALTDKSVAYWRAAAAACKPYKAGVYGDWELLERIGRESALNVQAAAKGWSWNWLSNKWRGPHPTAHMLQRPSTAYARPVPGWAGVRIDPLDILRLTPGWAKNPPAPVVRVAKPTLKLRTPRMRGAEVVLLQRQLRFWNWSTGPADGVFGTVTQQGVKRMQSALKVTADGIYGPVTAAAYQKFANDMAALAVGK